MADDKLYTELLDKMQQEQQQFRDWLLKQSPDEILGHAYEYCTREDILAEAEEIELRPAQMQALMGSPSILGDIFKDFCKCETDVMEQIKQCIKDRADKNLEKVSHKEYPAVYTRSAAYARQHDELPQYRESNRLNEQCRDEIDAAVSFPDSEIAAFAERPTPAVTSGKITKVAKVNGTWLIWFNGEPSYCCTHGAKGQPEGCPTYTYVDTSTVNADQCIPGDHYGNQIRIWGGLNQLSLGDADDLPAVFSADEGEEISLLDFCASIYDDVQMYIIENFPESTAAEIYLTSADELLNGVETYASARGYYTYIYNPGRAGWQTVALIGPEIGEEEPEPEPVVQEYYASWEAPAQTASGSFDFSYGIRTDKIQLKTQEKVDGATIEIEPITKSGSIDGSSWSISPADKQIVTTSGHTADDNYQKNGGDAAASWSLHYGVTKTTGSRNGQVGPFTTQEAADAAANSARDAAIAELQGEAQNAVNHPQHGAQGCGTRNSIRG